MINNSHVHVFYRDTSALNEAAVALAGRYLSIEERSRRAGLHFEEDRRDFTIAHDLLRRALSRYADVPPTDWQFVSNDYGKPSIGNASAQLRTLSFSLSYTRGCAACAITASTLVGIDVESIDCSREYQCVADRFFSKEEASWLRRCSGDLYSTRFTELWTLKEAFLKAVGIGLSGSLAEASFRFHDGNRIELAAPSSGRRWHFTLFEPTSDVRLAVAVQSIRPRFLFENDDGNEHMPHDASVIAQGSNPHRAC